MNEPFFYVLWTFSKLSSDLLNTKSNTKYGNEREHDTRYFDANVGSTALVSVLPMSPRKKTCNLCYFYSLENTLVLNVTTFIVTNMNNVRVLVATKIHPLSFRFRI